MTRLAYVNGQFCPHDYAVTHIEDRGYQFSDAVYEVIPILDGRLVDLDGHFKRFWRSLNELEIAPPMSQKALTLLTFDLVRRNAVYNGNIYMQISRGIAPRKHIFPEKSVRPVLVMVTNQIDHKLDGGIAPPVKVKTVPDIRWQRRDIKTVSLLANCLANEQADRVGAYEAWQIDEKGYITEGSHSNAWIVNKNKCVISRNATHHILNGITRLSLLNVIEKIGFSVEDRAFTLDEAYNAEEAFATSSGAFVKPVCQIDDIVLNDGKIGTITHELFNHYRDYCKSDSHPSAFTPLNGH